MQTLLARLICRCAIGIDVHSSGVYALVLRRNALASQTLRIERMGIGPLSAGVVSGAQWVDPEAVAAAITKAIFTGSHSPGPPGHLNTVRVAMALPQSAVLRRQLSIPLHFSHAALEPLVLAESERALGIEAAELSADWYCAESDHAAHPLTIAATPRRYTEVRLEATARAGLRLNTIDLESAAALRACFFAATYRRPDRQAADQPSCSAIWLGQDGLQIGILRASRIESEQYISCEDLSSTALIERLQSLAQTFQPKYVLVSGLNASKALVWVSEALRCPAYTLDLSACCSIHPDACASRTEGSGALFAVAFGLALRGVLE